MTAYVVYDTASGRVKRLLNCEPSHISANVQTGESSLEGVADSQTQYISGGAITARPSITATWNKTTIAANGADAAVLGATLPNPTTVSVKVPAGAVSPSDETVTGGSFSLATPIAGSYAVTVTPPFPTRVHTQTITAS